MTYALHRLATGSYDLVGALVRAVVGSVVREVRDGTGDDVWHAEMLQEPAMRVTHTLSATGQCPVDQTEDRYTIVVRTRLLVKVEDIRAVVDDLLQGPLFQEAFTRNLKQRLPDADEVETRCFHQGARVETVAIA